MIICESCKGQLLQGICRTWKEVQVSQTMGKKSCSIVLMNYLTKIIQRETITVIDTYVNNVIEYKIIIYISAKSLTGSTYQVTILL
jgi:hypothetical protein